MTTATISNERASPLPFLALAGVVLAVILAAVLSSPRGRFATRAHSEKHAEAAQIRECFQANGSKQVWQDDERPSIEYHCVELEPEPCPRWAVLILQVWPSIVDGCDYRERTSFVPRGGEPNRVMRWLSRIAERIE